MRQTPAQLLGHHLEYLQLMPTHEYRFHPKRRWRFDFAWPDIKFAVEVEGGIWTGGRHTRGKGFENDLEKYAHALLLGWSVLRVGDKMIHDGTAIQMIQQLLRH